MKREFVAFSSIVLILLAAVIVTSPYLVSHTRIGLEFRGGYEILYSAESPVAGQAVDAQALLEAAKVLESRANSLGVAEPEVTIEGGDQIRVKLAGVSSNEQVRAIMNKPGAMPLKLAEKYSQTVGGVLGASDLSDTLRAGLIAIALVFMFLAAVYRVPGLVGIFSLVIYLWLLLVVFNLLNATLSLAAIVAFVLGIGIASDANILFYERIKDEIRKGTPIAGSIQQGMEHSFRTILDSNITNVIGAAVLFFAGIGPIKGFALTMVLGIIVSLLTNVLMSRFLLGLLQRSGLLGKPSLFAIGKSPWSGVTNGNFDFVSRRNVFFAASSLIAVAGIFMVMTTPLNYDIDFKAGTALDISVGAPIAQDAAESLMEDAGVPPATVAIGGSNKDQVAARFDDVLNSSQVNDVIAAFREKYGDNVAYQENTANPAVARLLGIQAIRAIAFAVVAIFLFILLRFGWRFAAAAAFNVLNSAFFVVSIFAIFDLEIDVTFIAAILTVIGYSVNDTIVVFDRIRENMGRHKPGTEEALAALVNSSIRQVIKRSVYTVLTVVAGAACLLKFGAEPLQMFSLAILVGLVYGAYSSIFIATPLWFLLERGALEPPVSEVQQI